MSRRVSRIAIAPPLEKVSVAPMAIMAVKPNAKTLDPDRFEPRARNSPKGISATMICA